MCRHTWMYCDGNCHKCDVVATDATYIVKPIFNTTPITEEPLKMPPADGSSIPKEYWKRGDIQLLVNESRQAASGCEYWDSESNFCALYIPTTERHGQWKRVGDNTYRCSVCGEISCCNSPFCGECGAKMVNEDE